MAHLIHGEIQLDFHRNGNWQDLASILLMNGYILQVSVKDDNHYYDGGKIEWRITK